MVNEIPQEVPQSKKHQVLRPLGFWPCDLHRDSVHHDTPSAFPHIMQELTVQCSTGAVEQELTVPVNVKVSVQESAVKDDPESGEFDRPAGTAEAIVQKNCAKVRKP